MTFERGRALEVARIRRQQVELKARRIATIDCLMAGVMHALHTVITVTVPPIRPNTTGLVYSTTLEAGIKWGRSPNSSAVAVILEPCEITSYTDGTVVVSQWDGPDGNEPGGTQNV
jgi:hypothetical protein